MGEQVRIGDTLETVKERMAQMRAQLETLSRAIWQDIDHEDAAASGSVLLAHYHDAGGDARAEEQIGAVR